MASSAVLVRREPVLLPTYEPELPDKNPMFLEKRVYQGSSGRVYPLPFYNRISEEKSDRSWDAIYIENEFIKVMVLPEIGGRIHIGQDKTNGYDMFYRQNVIKPSLVGLAGPWASGGVEFNWPQHHRPATFMPMQVEFEAHADGSKTIWLSDHDPLERMKGMHGVCLYPGRAVIELKMRAYNRTPYVQSFLWWANVATHVHEGYQSFFPPDVAYIADHAKRATSQFPLCEGSYYGVDYGSRRRHGIPKDEIPPSFVPPHCQPEKKSPRIPDYAPNDLSWYANIPVPTSYMCLGSKQDFSGGYDHLKGAGLIQIADHHIAPGKKQWTWGNHLFGYAWDRNLTDSDGPYVELMIGVYTDNQPDFSFLQPGETKAWSVYWYPIQVIGAAQAANLKAAVSIRLKGRRATIGVAVTQRVEAAQMTLSRGEKIVQTWNQDLAPNRPLLQETTVPAGSVEAELRVRVCDAKGAELIEYTPQLPVKGELPAPATEPAAPENLKSADELYVTGLHLAQYRHATRSAVAYWQEALRRDAGDARCNNAMGSWHLRRGEFVLAETAFRTAIARLISRNPNPYDGEPYYHLGLSLEFQQRFDDAYDAFAKAAWNQPWQSASYHALAEIDARRNHWPRALDHVERSLRVNTDNLRARNLRALILRRLGRNDEANTLIADTLALDPLDHWARNLHGDDFRGDTQIRFDLAFDNARAGLYEEAVTLIEHAKPESLSGTAPMVGYTLAYFYERLGRSVEADAAVKRGAAASPDYCFPSRLEDILVLESVLIRNPTDARAAYYLGNLFYDRRRYAEAIRCWVKSAKLEPTFSIVWRNLGVAYFNVERAPTKARKAYERAFAANPADPRLLYERDQLWKRLGLPTKRRLREFEKHLRLVGQRDDATIELCALYNQLGAPEKALPILAERKFQPWEGGEGQALGQFVRTHLALGRVALDRDNVATALREFTAALSPTPNLGEAKHLLANQNDLYYWLGEACARSGDKLSARGWWTRASKSHGDFLEMSVRRFSEMTYFSALSLEKLGQRAAARFLFAELLAYAVELSRTPAKVDYFATSLPTMLLFEDDLAHRQQTTALFLRAQAEVGLGLKAAARLHLAEVLKRDPSHAAAGDLTSVLSQQGRNKQEERR